MSAFISSERYFDPESGRLSAYFSKLFILIGQESVQYCILDTEKNAFVALADFSLPATPRTPEAFYAEITLLIMEEEALKKKYPSVVLGLETPVQTLVPAPLFDPEQNTKYLEFNFGTTGFGEIRTDKLVEIDAFNIFGIPQGLLDSVRVSYGEVAVFHRSSALIRAIYNHQKINPASGGIYLNVRSRFIDLALIASGRLVFFNSYSCTSKEDILYYTLYAMEQLNLRPGNTHLFLSGRIDSGDDLHNLLVQYIHPVLFFGRLNLWGYSPLLSQLAAHRYQELYALALCGS